MDINAANLEELSRQLDRSFQAGLDLVERSEDMRFLTELTKDIPSFTKKHVYVWLNRIPGFKEWIETNGRKFEDVISDSFEVVNVSYEDSVRIKRTELEDNQAGQLAGMYSPIVQMMGESWSELKLRNAINIFIDNATCLTGDALFANTHATKPWLYGSYAMDNLSTNTLTADNFQACFTAGAAWKYANGELVRPRFTHLVVGESQRTIAWNIVKNTYVADSNATIENPNKMRVELIVDPLLNATAGADGDVDAEHYWYLVDNRKAIPAIVNQMREDVSTMNDTDPATLKRTGFVDYMADGRMAAAPTFPHLVYGNLATAAPS